MRERPFTNLFALVEQLAENLLPYFDKPFAFFGHSMGAMIAFELTRRLRETSGKQPVHLFVSGRRAPQIPGEDEATYNLPDGELVEELRRLNGTPKEVLDNPELMQIMLPFLRADFEIVQTYAYSHGEPLTCPITAYGGMEDHEEHRAMLEGWREQTTADFILRMLPGDHFFLHSSEALLLKTLAQELEKIARAVALRTRRSSF
jgi:medium-chain acyl-[acyl-carrier-protein] hydrolase